MKKLYLSIAVLTAILISFTTYGQAGCSTLAITNTTATGANITCSGSATFTATATGTGDDIYWFDAATGGNVVHQGATFQTPTLTSTTSYWAAEVNEDASGALTCESPRVQETATVTGNPNLDITSTTPA